MGSCQNDTTEGFKGFESDKSEIKTKAAGGEHSITIRSDREWTAQADVPWLMISPANGRGEVECRVKVDSTLVNDPRTTTVRFMSDGEILQQIAITQDGFAHSIAASTDFVSIEASAVRAERYVEVDVKANVEFDVVSDVEWLSVGDYTLTLDRGARPRSTRLHIDWKMNSDPESREAMLMLVPKNGETLEKPATIKVRQLAGPLIEDNRNGDSLAVVTIYNKMECWSEGVLSTTEPMDRWECLRLWKSSDKSLPCAEAIGLVSLPDNFAELGDTLEGLYLDSNNFAAIPEVLSPENFPHLTALDLSSNRRYSLSDLRGYSSRDGIYANMDNDDAVSRLLLWENLEELGLSYNYIEGRLPDFKSGEGGIRAYTDADIAERGDTLRWAVENNLPRVLPNVRALRINLNFMTGELPEWLLYHPNLMEWAAEVLVFPQQEKSYNSAGEVVGFSNTPTSREYYFEAYPLYRSRYEFNDEME